MKAPFNLRKSEEILRNCLGYDIRQGKTLGIDTRHMINIELWLTTRGVYFCDKRFGSRQTKKPFIQIPYSDIINIKVRHLLISGRHNFFEIEKDSGEKYLLSVGDVDYQFVLDTIRGYIKTTD